MPSPVTTDLPVPKSWDEFEDITAAVMKLRWATPNVTRNGRNGQRQHGVDIYGRARHLDNRHVGAQCKRYGDALRWKDITDAVTEAEAFEPALAEFYFVTTAPRDATIQKDARLLTEGRRQLGKFPVEILFWDDLCLDLVGDKTLLATFFPGWSKLNDNEKDPHIDVTWLDGDGAPVSGDLVIVAPAPRLLDVANEFEPFLDDELDQLRARAPDQLPKAIAYNDAAAVAKNNGELQSAWLASTVRKRFDAGRRFGLSVSVGNTTAHDILVTIDFPPEIDVFEIDDPPSSAKAPELPRPPRIKLPDEDERVVRALDSRERIESLVSRFAVPAPDVALLRFPGMHPHRIRVEGQTATAQIARMPQRRRWDFAGDNGIVLASRVPSGRFVAEWTADAENLSVPITGQVTIVVEPSSEQHWQSYRRPYVLPKLRPAVELGGWDEPSDE